MLGEPEMEDVVSRWKLKVLVFAIVASIASFFFTINEFLYLVNSREATATISKTYPAVTRGRFGSAKSQKLAIEYEFVDADGLRRSGRDDVRGDWPIPSDGKVKVRYRPGEDGACRLAGRVNWGAILIFIVCLGVVGFLGFRVIREANQAYAPRGGKRSK
jgi:hypothetical protein